MIPRATYRLQFHKGFPFAAGAALAPYLAGLGVSHVYASPIAAARVGSIHGYDVIDPARINPELGGEAGFRAMAAALRREGLGIVLDVVPNHMAVGGDDNVYWLDVLEKGAASPYAPLFDIDWNGPDPALRGKVLAPFLGAPYGEALAAGDIRLAQDGEGAIAAVAYGTHRFPIRQQDRAEVLARGLDGYDPATADGRAALHGLFERQHWRLAHWMVAGDAINWRRFFDITGLAGLRMEWPAAFELVHALPLRLYAEGLIDGLRIDHVDGLADPSAYCRKLRDRLDAARPGEHAYLVVEKILGRSEPLAPDWGVDGTTGYDFMNEVSLLLHDPAGADTLSTDWALVSGDNPAFEAQERTARGEILGWSFNGQLAGAAAAFERLANALPDRRDITYGGIERALTSLAKVMPVYRTYATADGLPDWNDAVLARAVEAARPLQAPGEAVLLDQVADWLRGDGDPGLRAEAARRWQQLTAPVAAKAVEDTLFYRNGRLLSRNDVGFDADRIGAPIAELHAAFAARAANVPHAMLATATHDHKRGEDARARLAVLSETPAAWSESRRRWTAMNRRESQGVHPIDEAMLYQSLVGAWPLAAPDREGLAALKDRLAGWQQKALREAKQRSSWAAPDLAYEARCHAFLEHLLEADAAAAFREDLARFIDWIAPAGALNGLAQTLLRCLAPGMPDLYQGGEFWDFSLVDPDNRRPIDFPAREASLGSSGSIVDLMPTWRDGRIKQALIRRALEIRASHAAILAGGAYRPLQVFGPRASSIFAFSREGPGGAIVAVTAIRSAAAVSGQAWPVPPGDWWEGTEVILPEARADVWADALTSRTLNGARVSASQLLADLPVALLVSSR